MLQRSKRIAAREGRAAAAEQQLPLPHPSAMDAQGNPTVDNAASGSPREACSSNALVPQVQQVGSTATAAGALDAAPVWQQGETMMAFLAHLDTYMQQVREEQQREAAAETARLNAIARDAEQRRRQHAEAAANHNKARKDAASVLMQQEAAHTTALQAWNVDPAQTAEPIAEEQTKSALAAAHHIHRPGQRYGERTWAGRSKLAARRVREEEPGGVTRTTGAHAAGRLRPDGKRVYESWWIGFVVHFLF
ncbi:hypothetical protein CBR_g37372 [Chara braunii]|uniref:Uncharacterized protein n=1 Tax=Chara braunii TaxID=69332 RepID=A0A388JZU7_CHABU|nr:hypothetical protein CBR_g37372 [Chara braunii]|eukprot:GBG63286.1 hypothetical protein CBR_g37372 [Chara braunii]